ncbi:hypothetical protein EON81_27165, partial [bacterium]
MATLLDLVFYAQVASRIYTPKADFTVGAIGYAPFSMVTEGGYTSRHILRNHLVPRRLSSLQAQGYFALIIANWHPGPFQRQNVRFVLRLKNGHELAVDADGGVRVDRLTGEVPPSVLAALVEGIAPLFPEVSSPPDELPGELPGVSSSPFHSRAVQWRAVRSGDVRSWDESRTRLHRPASESRFGIPEIGGFSEGRIVGSPHLPS